jgi:drug/metabolite transporter (DMT)-like permease
MSSATIDCGLNASGKQECEREKQRDEGPSEAMTMHSKGLLLTALGILLISPDSLLIRLIGMDIWSTSAWRGGIVAIGMTMMLLCVYRGRFLDVFRSIGWFGLFIALVSTATNFAFVAGIKFTSVANALLILASTPFHAAVMSRIFLGEKIALRTWVAIFAGLGGIAIIVSDGLGQLSAFGDAMALLGAVLLAAQLTLVRSRRDINMVPAIAVGAGLSGLIAVVIGGPPAIPNQMQALWIIVMGFLVLTPATALMTLGPRYISSPEVGLIVLLETVLGPFWVWLVINEVPTIWALVGGAIVIMTLLVHSLLSLRDAARRQAG